MSRFRSLIAGAALIPLLAVTPAATAKPAQSHGYKVTVTFTQNRLWTYYHEQTSPDCTRTEDGQGSEDATFTSKALFALPAKGTGVAGFGVVGTDNRAGSRTHTVAGSECAASAVFPSTWSKIAEGDGTVTYAEPTTDCGPRPTKVGFPTLELNGKQLDFQWNASLDVPDFGSCPDFEGSNEAQDGHELPRSDYYDVSTTVNRHALLAAKHPVTARGIVDVAETETCQNIVQGCPEGVTYNSTGSVHVDALFVFKPKKH